METLRVAASKVIVSHNDNSKTTLQPIPDILIIATTPVTADKRYNDAAIEAKNTFFTA
ncbi:MAG: hypothetical protein KME50_11785 [Nostoc desertorum CM1-VF14]|nr:hypothetical protein [Nostoc desertorum CM1-VF14]